MFLCNLSELKTHSDAAELWWITLVLSLEDTGSHSNQPAVEWGQVLDNPLSSEV